LFRREVGERKNTTLENACSEVNNYILIFIFGKFALKQYSIVTAGKKLFRLDQAG